MKVVLAEKPSVARELAAFLGARMRKDGWIEGEGYQVTWAFGHLVTLKEPDEYDPALKRWNLEALPIVPEKFALKLTGDDGAQKQYETVASLMRDADELICATDAGREGELIFRYIVEMSGCEAKPMSRLWLSSLTETAIRTAFDDLRPGAEYLNLYAAARCRSEADWLVGMNATRNYTVRHGQAGVLWSVGRVQTPVLALIVRRDDEIRLFQSDPWWELRTAYRDVVFRQKADRFTAQDAAEAALAEVTGKPLRIDGIETKEEQLKPPQLFDLTSLQREMNTRFGMTAADTLQQAQALYERKAITYPRTDSRYLTKEMHAEIGPLFEKLAAGYPEEIGRLDLSALPDHARIFNDAKVGDHHAIIPTGTSPGHGNDRRLFDVIAKRTIAAFYPPCKRDVTVVEASVEKTAFRARGVRVTDPGWTLVTPSQADSDKPKGRGKDKDKDRDEDAQELPAFEVGESGPHEPLLKHGETRPPRHFTENSLLGIMETAGKLIEDEQLREAMKSRGLGTPATRAAIIETLLRRRYIRREKKQLRATDLGRTLIALLRDPILTSAEMTGEWEAKLQDIERGDLAREAFMGEIVSFVTTMLENSKNARIDGTRLGDCPRCGKPVIEGRKGYGCSAWESGCEFVLWKEYQSHEIGRYQASELLQLGISRKPVRVEDESCQLYLTDQGGVTHAIVPTREQQRGDAKPRRGRAGGKKASASKAGVSQPGANGASKARAKKPKTTAPVACPFCQGGLVELPDRYGCVAHARGCAFSVPKTLAGKKVTKPMVKKLVTKGVTQVLKGFQSQDRTFDARIRLQNGRVELEVENGQG